MYNNENRFPYYYIIYLKYYDSRQLFELSYDNTNSIQINRFGVNVKNVAMMSLAI